MIMALISMKFYFTAVACKQKWQCLRDSYRRALNKKKGKSGQAAKNIKLWKYESEMAFVAPYFVERKAHNSVEIRSDDELSDNTDENHALEKHNTDIENDDIPVNVTDANSTRLSDDDRYNESQQIYTKKPKAIKRKAVQPESSASAILMAKLIDDQNKPEPSRGHDELDRFFLNISDTVKKFPPYVQALAKNKIFSLVSEMELQQLAPFSSTPYAFNPSPQPASTSAAPMSTTPDNWNNQKSQPIPTNLDNWSDHKFHIQLNEIKNE